MAAVPHRHAIDPVSDPVPAMPSDESLRKAEALREALRRKLLNVPEPEADPYWVVGAD